MAMKKVADGLKEVLLGRLKMVLRKVENGLSWRRRFKMVLKKVKNCLEEN